MIHIASVHLDTDVWFKYQLRYLEQHISEEYQLYMSLPALIKKDPDFSQVHYALTNASGVHATIISALAAEMMRQSSDLNDIFIFLDGDAFPIGDIMPFVRERLKEVPLVAVQRRENLGEAQPHPIFCATTAGFWKSLPGTWELGIIHRYDKSRVLDPGGLLLQRLEKQQVEWCKMRRTNKRSAHPLWFGVYGDLIYHHGAAFRMGEPFLMTALAEQSKKYYDRFFGLQARGIPPAARLRGERLTLNKELAEAVEAWIDRDPTFYEWFLGSDKKPTPELPPFCEHKNLHFKGIMFANQICVECLDCLSRGPVHKQHALAASAFREAARQGTLHTVASEDWLGRYNFDSE